MLARRKRSRFSENDLCNRVNRRSLTVISPPTQHIGILHKWVNGKRARGTQNKDRSRVQGVRAARRPRVDQAVAAAGWEGGTAHAKPTTSSGGGWEGAGAHSKTNQR